MFTIQNLTTSLEIFKIITISFHDTNYDLSNKSIIVDTILTFM